MPLDDRDDTADQPAARVRRKRVIAREVEAENTHAAHLTPEALGDTVDATVLGGDEIVWPGHGLDRDAPVVVVEDALADELRTTPPGGEARAIEADPLPVVDPTLLGSRRRRSSHQRLYRWTQVLTLACAAVTVAGLICTMLDEPLVGRWLAGGAALPGMIAWRISGQSDLSRRWRGWAVAALVFAVVTVGITFLHEHMVEHDAPATQDPGPAIRKK